MVFIRLVRALLFPRSLSTRPEVATRLTPGMILAPNNPELAVRRRGEVISTLRPGRESGVSVVFVASKSSPGYEWTLLPGQVVNVLINHC